MFIRFSKTSYVLGESVPVEITYDNPTGERVVMEDPAKSLYVQMHAVDIRSREDLSYSMGKVVVTDIDKANDQYVLSEPPIEDIEIEPESSLVFSSDLNDRLYIRPGSFECFLTDHDTKESNHIEITVAYTKESVAYLLGFAVDENRDYGRREWAMEWLQELYPDFKLKLSLESDSGSIKERNEAHNETIYDEFGKWWDSNKDTKQTEVLLKQVSEELF